MAIVISGVNNNDKITAVDGVIDSISGFNLAGIITASSFTGDLTGDVTGNISGNNGVFGDFVSVGSNIQLGQAGIITATTLVGNVTGNVNNTGNLLLQIGGSEKFRVASSGQLGIGGANYGTSGQVLTSGGSGSAATWSTITGTTINNNSANRLITGEGGTTLNGEANLTFDGLDLTLTGSMNSTGIVTATAFIPSSGQLSHRNAIVNGAMQVAQRGTSSASADFASVDRMKMSVTNIDQLAFLQKQTSDGPDGFSKCFEFDVTTIENALDADDLVYMRYAVEAQDLAPFFNANGSGKNFTLSFYVKAYQTGTYQVAIYKADATAQFITRTYTIASSGVWQRVVLNFTGDTGTSGINADNGLGFQISFMLAAGTNYTSGSEQSTWGGWPGNPGFAAGHAVNTLSSTNNYWRITGIQLELGDVATPFEHRSFGDEFLRCARYFQSTKGLNTSGAISAGTNNIQMISTGFYVPMRDTPSVVFYNGTTINHVRSPGGSSIDVSNVSSYGRNKNGINYINLNNSPFSAGDHYQFSYTAESEL